MNVRLTQLATALILVLALIGSPIDSAEGAMQAAPGVVEFPSDHELFPRDVATNLGSIAISGYTDGSSSEVQLETYRDGVLTTTTSHAIDANNQYSFAVDIPAELASRDYVLSEIDAAGTVSLIAQADDVVAGDVFVINGQSNAVAHSYTGSNGLDLNPFVRTYGGWALDTWDPDDNWHVARQDCRHEPGCVGQWGLRLGSQLSLAEQIPIAIINEARGATEIPYFQRDPANAANLTTNFGRLLTRLTNAGIEDDIRALAWYQGESDSGDPPAHMAGFTQLFADWEFHYPDIERFYVFQVRLACGVPVPEISNFQREFSLDRDNVTTVSTSGLDGFDGCHYTYEDGYQSIGDNLTRMVRRDLYGQSFDNADSPDIETATIVDPLTVEMTFTANNQLIADDGFEALFGFSDPVTGADFAIADGTVLADSTVRITLADPIPAGGGALIRYSTAPYDQDWITNTVGIGIQVFIDFPVGVQMLAGDTNCSGTVTIADAVMIAQAIVDLRTDSGGCPMSDTTTQINLAAADTNNNGTVSIADAVLVAQCTAGLDNVLCP